MKQQQLFPSQCPAEDDNGVRCTNQMTDKEIKQDGMCARCADEIWNSLTHNAPFVISSKAPA